MNATTNDVTLAGIGKALPIESTDSLRCAQNNLLSELPGVIFGLLTLGYLVSSLLALA